MEVGEPTPPQFSPDLAGTHVLHSVADRINALSCIRFLVIFEIVTRTLKIIAIAVVLILTREEACEAPLKTFLAVYMGLSIVKGAAFYFKNRSFFTIQRIPDFEEGHDASLVNNFIEAGILFWYIVGFHWLQECQTCKAVNPLLYYSTVLWIILGFFTFIAPLFAIILLLLLVAYARPKLRVVTFHAEEGMPDGHTHCTICFEDYAEGAPIKFLPCNHHFHGGCIDRWFQVKDSCPLCKKHVNILYDIVEGTDTVDV